MTEHVCWAIKFLKLWQSHCDFGFSYDKILLNVEYLKKVCINLIRMYFNKINSIYSFFDDAFQLLCGIVSPSRMISKINAISCSVYDVEWTMSLHLPIKYRIIVRKRGVGDLMSLHDMTSYVILSITLYATRKQIWIRSW